MHAYWRQKSIVNKPIKHFHVYTSNRISQRRLCDDIYNISHIASALSRATMICRLRNIWHKASSWYIYYISYIELIIGALLLYNIIRYGIHYPLNLFLEHSPEVMFQVTRMKIPNSALKSTSSTDGRWWWMSVNLKQKKLNW